MRRNRSSGKISLKMSASTEPPMATTIDTIRKIEFPTSPQQPTLGEEILHYSHPQHPLLQVTSALDSFNCAGCKENGAGKRFACQNCDFQLHEFCALSPPLLKTHPLHAHHQLLLHSKPKTGGIMWPRCDVCGKATKGFTFRCGACNFQMHPCCAMLSNEMNFSALGVHPHSLRLLPPTFTTTDQSASPATLCGECKRKRSGRVYRCTVCADYYLHAVCAKTMINGLQANGFKPSSEKPSMLGPAGRTASQVFIEFIGRLFEGFGEALGQDVIQTIASGRGNTTTRRRS